MNLIVNILITPEEFLDNHNTNNKKKDVIL